MKLPAWLARIGLAAFAFNETLFFSAVNRTAPEETVIWQNVHMKMVQPPEDNTIQRLKGEIRWSIHHGGGGDMYRLSRMKSVTPGDVIVDVGSNIGDFALSVVARFPGVRVLALEPSPLTHFYLCWNLWLNNVPVLSHSEFGQTHSEFGGVLPLNKVADGEDVFFFWGPTMTMNALAMTGRELERHGDPRSRFTYAAAWTKSQVAAFDLPRFLYKHEVNKIRFMKVDCEGCEYRVLSSWASHGWLSREKLDFISGEMHAKWQSAQLDPHAVASTMGLLNERGCGLKSRMATEFAC